MKFLSNFLLVQFLIFFGGVSGAFAQSLTEVQGSLADDQESESQLLSYYSRYWALGGQDLRDRAIDASTWQASEAQRGHLYDLLVRVVREPEAISDTEKLSILLAVMEQIAGRIGEDAEIFEVLNYARNVHQADVEYDIVTNPAYGWDGPADPEQTEFHVIGIEDPGTVEKYNHPDGREAVFVRNLSGVMVPLKDGTNDATYNYVANYNGANFARTANDNYQHMVLDVVPWLVYGVSPQDQTTISERLEAFENSAIIRRLQVLYLISEATTNPVFRAELTLDLMGVTLDQIATALEEASGIETLPSSLQPQAARDQYLDQPAMWSALQDGLYGRAVEACSIDPSTVGDAFGRHFQTVRKPGYSLGYETTCTVTETRQEGEDLLLISSCDAEGELYDWTERWRILSETSFRVFRTTNGTEDFVLCEADAPPVVREEWTETIVFDVSNVYSDCVMSGDIGCLRDAGASEQTIRFIQARAAEGGQGPVVPVDFQELGQVDVAHLGTFSAAGVTYPYFVNTAPDTISSPLWPEEDLTTLASRGDPVAASLLQEFPDAYAWHRFVGGMRNLPNGNQRFSLMIVWTEFCRACPIIGFNIAIVDYDGAGRFRSFETSGVFDNRSYGTMPRHSAQALASDPALLQLALNMRGYGAGAMDGIPGQRTRTALAEFQVEMGLNAGTGQTDLATLTALANRSTLFERESSEPERPIDADIAQLQAVEPDEAGEPGMLFGCAPANEAGFPDALSPTRDGPSTLLGRTASGNSWSLELSLSTAAEFTNSTGTVVEGFWLAVPNGLCQSYDGRASWVCHDVLACEGETDRYLMRNAQGELSSVVEAAAENGTARYTTGSDLFAFGDYATDLRFCDIDGSALLENGDAILETGDSIGSVRRRLDENGWYFYESVCQPQDYTVSGDIVTMTTLCSGEGTQWPSSMQVQRLSPTSFRDDDRTFFLCPQPHDQQVAPETSSTVRSTDADKEFAAPEGSLWVQVASRQSLSEARQVASGLGEEARIFRTQNSWYAITATILQEPEWSALDEIVRAEGWPSDSLLSRGSGFIDAIAVDPNATIPTPAFTYTTAARQTQLFARTMRGAQPIYEAVLNLNAGEDVVVWGEPDVFGDCLASGHEGVFIKCADLSAFQQEAELGADALIGTWRGTTTAGASTFDYFWQIEPNGENVSGLIHLRRQPSDSWTVYQFTGQFADGTLWFRGTSWVTPSSDGFCMASGELVLTGSEEQLLLDGVWGGNPIAGGCPASASGGVALTKQTDGPAAQQMLGCSDPAALLGEADILAFIENTDLHTREGAGRYVVREYGSYDRLRDLGRVALTSDYGGRWETFDREYTVRHGALCSRGLGRTNWSCEQVARCALDGEDARLHLLDDQGRTSVTFDATENGLVTSSSDGQSDGLAGRFEVPEGFMQWLQIASRPNLEEARGLATLYEDQFPETRIFEASNGWYAITVALLDDHFNNADQVVTLKQEGAIPSDALLTSGSTFVTEFPIRAGEAVRPAFWYATALRDTPVYGEAIIDGQVERFVGGRTIRQGEQVGVWIRDQDNCVITAHGNDTVACGDLAGLEAFSQTNVVADEGRDTGHAGVSFGSNDLVLDQLEQVHTDGDLVGDLRTEQPALYQQLSNLVDDQTLETILVNLQIDIGDDYNQVWSSPVYQHMLEGVVKLMLSPQVQRLMEQVGFPDTSYIYALNWPSWAEARGMGAELAMDYVFDYIISVVEQGLEDYEQPWDGGTFEGFFESAIPATLQQSKFVLGSLADQRQGNYVDLAVGVFTQTASITTDLYDSVQIFRELQSIDENTIEGAISGAVVAIEIQETMGVGGQRLPLLYSRDLNAIALPLMVDGPAWTVDTGRKLNIISELVLIRSLQIQGRDISGYIDTFNELISDYEGTPISLWDVYAETVTLGTGGTREYSGFSRDVAHKIGLLAERP